ncbi:protein FAM207A [Tachyglossus aculeatus]|uniref:protein FAM207A n=1 Tax=Tachyglossus aculeatus TaxID=9261 RepID=UPI0018F6E3B9|nr:protein FAM207A [Tachyglossus aculeatus]
MVGKVRRLRTRWHQAAVRAPEPAQAQKAAAAAWSGPDGGDWGFLTSNIFAGTKIDPKALVQKLDSDTRSVISVKKVSGAEAKPILSKKEKMKQRRERWQQKIEAVKMAQQKHKAAMKRKATPVVGDMHPLMDALPELSELITTSKSRKQRRSNVKKKAEPTDFNRMNPAQKRKLLEEEMARFQEVIANPSYRANPLTAISEHLSKKMRQEEMERP